MNPRAACSRPRCVFTITSWIVNTETPAATLIMPSACRLMAKRAASGSTARSFPEIGNRLDLHQHFLLGERRLHRGPRGRVGRERLRELLVHGLEIPDVR